MIGDKIITRATLQHWIAIGTHARTGAPEPPDYTACIERLRSTTTSTAPHMTERLREACRQEYDALMPSALSSLIHAQWLAGEAAGEGLKVDTARLKRESSLNGQHGAEVQEALASTETISDVRFNLIASQISDQIYRKLEREVPAATRTRISDYYERHKKSFVVPEQRDLHVIRVATDAAAKKTKGELESGTSFATLVKRTSLIQPGGSHDGLLLGLRPEDWPEPPLSQEVFHARPKTLHGPVNTSFGYYVFEVVRSIPAHQRTLAEVEPEIAKQLHQMWRYRIVSRFVAAFRKKWIARTNCLPGYVVKHCRQFRSPKANFQGYQNVL